jgi:hypothetical protein
VDDVTRAVHALNVPATETRPALAKLQVATQNAVGRWYNGRQDLSAVPTVGEIRDMVSTDECGTTDEGKIAKAIKLAIKQA